MSSEIVLVNVSGRTKAGLMVMLTSTMARFQVRVLDVGQAVIHDELSLGMMLEVPAGQNSAELLAALGEALDEDLRFAHVSGVDYQQWVAQQGKTRHIVTLLAAGVSAEQLAAVVEIVERHGLSIEAIRRLSGRVRINLEDPGLPQDPGRGKTRAACKTRASRKTQAVCKTQAGPALNCRCAASLTIRLRSKPTCSRPPVA